MMEVQLHLISALKNQNILGRCGAWDSSQTRWQHKPEPEEFLTLRVSPPAHLETTPKRVALIRDV